MVGAVTACAVATASAQGTPIELATGPGREIVEKYCGSTCHSLDYLTMNSSILDDKGWTNEENKMIDVFGALIKSAETTIIVELSRKELRHRSRRPLEARPLREATRIDQRATRRRLDSVALGDGRHFTDPMHESRKAVQS